MENRLDILLVNPGNKLSQFGNVSSYATVAQPLGVAMLASYIRERGFSVAILDAEAENWSPEEATDNILKYNPKLVGLTAFTTKVTAAGKIMRLVKERAPHIKTVIGGHHASAMPRRTLEEEAADFVINGEGYYPTSGLLETLKNDPNAKEFPIRGVCYKRDNEIVLNPPALLTDSGSLAKLSFPAWDLLPMKKYQAHHWQCWNIGQKNSFALVYSSLGCPFSCNFCSVNVVYGKRGVRYLDPEIFVKGIDHLVQNHGIKHLELIDDTFTLNKKRVVEICDLLADRKYNLNMWCFARTNTVEPAMADKMKKAGINWVFLGIEAGDDNILKSVSKHQDTDIVRKAVKILKESGIYVGGNYVFGLAEDNYESMQKTVDFALELNTEWANFFVSMAYPGTKLYADAVGKGVLPKKWEQYGFFAPNSLPLPSKHLPSEEIIKFRDKAFNTYFGSASYQSLVRQKFGPEIEEYIKKMLTKKLERVTNPEREEISLSIA